MGICVSCRRREKKAPEKRSAPGTGGPVKGTAAAELLPRRWNRLQTMANSMSNIKITNPIKGIVSKRRRRYQEDGFNLDLAYITERLIAMGIPADRLEGVLYRNHIDEVFRFLEQMHKDRYQIYNLCSERSYDESKFHQRVVGKYAFDDHTPPKIEDIQPFCEDVHTWLAMDPKNVAAVHCKAGKGRTGTMVCCYLLYSGQKATADEALKYYGNKRTHDDKGVTIPSQRRYVEYFSWLLRSGLQYTPTRVQIRALILSPPPPLATGQGSPELLVTQARNCRFNSEPFKKPPCTEVRRTADSIRVTLTDCTVLRGDVRVEVYKRMKMRKERLFHFWFNTFFVTAEMGGAERIPPMHDSPDLETYKLTLNKWELDDAHKDKQHKHYSQDFKVELIIEKVPESSTFNSKQARPPSPQSSSSSSGSEHETNWDSGELPYIRLSDPQELQFFDLPHDLYHPSADTTPDNSNRCPLTDDAKDAYFSMAAAKKSYYKHSGYYENGDYLELDFKDAGKSREEPSSRDGVDKEGDRKEFLKSSTELECCKAGSDTQSEFCKDSVTPAYQKDSREATDSDKNRELNNFKQGQSDHHKCKIHSSDNKTSKVPCESRERSDNHKKGEGYRPNGKKSESRTRLSLGDVRASWRGLSGKFNTDARKKKDDS